MRFILLRSLIEARTVVLTDWENILKRKNDRPLLAVPTGNGTGPNLCEGRWAISGKPTKRLVHSFILCLAAVFLSCNVLWAQIDQGAIRGTVQDPSGAVIPDAKVTLSNEDTGLLLQTTTSVGGTYSFSPIKIGTYTVSVTKPGFATVSHPHISVHVSEQAKADFSLNPGQVTQTVEVNSGLPLLETQSSEVGQDLTSRQVNDLPLNGRNYTFLAQVSAGVTGLQSGRVAGTGGFTANGLPQSHNSYILDGIDNNNDTIDFLNGNAFVVLTPPDAIQEVNVQTSNFSAEFGRAGSAVINATTKSGTNQFQGNFWEYLRNDKLDASTWSANRAGTPKPELRQNQFGFTVGGPVIIPHLYNGRNKTFFFGDYQGTRIAQTSLHNPSVPTDAQRSSDFTNFQDLIFNQSGTRSDALAARSRREAYLILQRLAPLPRASLIPSQGWWPPVPGMFVIRSSKEAWQESLILLRPARRV